MRCIRALLFAAMTSVSLPCVSHGSLIVGGSDLLSPAYASQLESWLGEGPLTLTNIFDYKYNGSAFDLATPFHAAADGMGRTFTLLKLDVIQPVDGPQAGQVLDVDEIIGGYNPQSWSSIEGFNLTYTDTEATAFLFNLTTGERQDQKLPSHDSMGRIQTYNGNMFGPVFGGGLDLYVHGTVGQEVDQFIYDGSVVNASYGFGMEDSIVSAEGRVALLSRISDLEVFTISPGISTEAVPEPTSLALLGLGALGAICRVRLRRSKVGDSSAAF